MSLLEKVVAVVTPSSSDEGTNAIDLLKKDHDEVEALFKEYQRLAEDNGGARERRELSTRICGLAAVHAMIEEEIFYPAARKAGVDHAMLNEAAIEHQSAKELIAQIGASRASDEFYDARVKVLGEQIQHHVKDEEGELFPACRKSGMDMDEIGKRLQQRKEQLMRKLHSQAA